MIIQCLFLADGGLQEAATDIQEITRESEGLLEINAVKEVSRFKVE